MAASKEIAMVKDEEDWDSASSSSTEGFRFGIADRVFCHFGGDWWPGKVLKQNYMPEKNIVYPYQVELDTYPESSKVYVTHDNDDHIRAFPPGGLDESRLRFQLGSRVQCIMDGGWKPGRIVDLNYTESNWGKNEYVPYQVRLDDGGLIYVPEDSNHYCRQLQSRPCNSHMYW
eukprot:CAMPEP_0197517350 /NCGR_PEP_ID=MMETSP1318-20131121/2330_1 /TAXON_ID=552666 /ORGANISM="Partenskyella glossopodia, Strain RCC365" /LENGTH=172 /DNA_ID=CAMNT_0043066819 /DNA_START=976 /DNA_END=1494 /DNA_ORIENTATION=-